VLLQLGGVGVALFAGYGEVGLLVAALLVAVGTPLSMWAIEAHVERIARRDTWAFAALLGPVGPIWVARLQPGTWSPRRPRPAKRTVADRVVSILIPLGLVCALAWGGRHWIAGYQWPFEPAPAEVRRAEVSAFQRLREIGDAQNRYRQADRNGDGAKTYAQFLIHLWQSVDIAGNPVRLELIDRELGFAMVREFALDGYTYESLQLRALATGAVDDRRGGVRELDSAVEWAVVARPAFPRKAGGRVFLADQTGAIWTASAAGVGRLAFPDDPAARGWIPVRSVEMLTELQAAGSE
jgi:hypothetical protein